MSSLTRRHFAGLIAGSALITLDGTAVTVTLPAIARDLSIGLSSLQWIGNAPLLVLAALLLRGGAVGDRYGRVRLMRWGLWLFAAASWSAAAAPGGAWLVLARLAQGMGAALVLPGAVATLRAAYADSRERARTFGVWAAWTGVAAAVGPLLGGALADAVSWRAVFVVSGAVGAAASLMLTGRDDRAVARTSRRLPVLDTVALAAVLGAVAYLLIEGSLSSWSAPEVWLAGVAAAAGSALLFRPGAPGLVPRELLRARNCLPANGATFALYFGVFGVSFLLTLYVQQVLDYSATWAGASVLPLSLMLFLAEPLGRLGERIGSRTLIACGSLTAGAGILWMAFGPAPLPFWSHIIPGAFLLGAGVSLAVSALTHAAVSAVPEGCAGAASGFNHAVVRAAGLLAIALLGSLAGGGEADGISADGFRRAMLVCGLIVALGGVASARLLKDEEPGGLRAAA